MKKLIVFVLTTVLITSCTEKAANKSASTLPLIGTWHLLSGTMITGKDTLVTDYTTGQQMLKIINDSHFAFVRHDLKKGKDTSNIIFSAGAGRYVLKGDQYTEHLDFCDARDWEGHSFNFTVSISNDTLVQQGIERLDNLGIDRVIIEKYIRVAK